MSRQPSPTPSSHLHSNQMPRAGLKKPPAQRSGRAPRPLTPKLDVAVAQPAPPVATSSSARTKGRAYPSGITANAEDAKYAAKYRELRVKVKEIEMQNDRLLYKVLQAKKNIQRAKLERAILYERLTTVTTSPFPGQGNSSLPPHTSTLLQQHGQAYPPAQQNSYVALRNQHPANAQTAPNSRGYVHNHHPIQPAPLRPLSPHESQSHHVSPPAPQQHPGQPPVSHAQQVCTVNTSDGPLSVLAGPDGRPIYTQDGHYIPADESVPQHASGSSGLHSRRRSGRVSAREKDLFEREAREKEAREVEYNRELREPERNPMYRVHEDERIRDHDEGDRRLRAPGMQASASGHPDSRPHSAHIHAMPLALAHPGAPQMNMSSSRDYHEHEMDRQREYDQERERRDREVDRERGRHATILNRSDGYPPQHSVHHYLHDRDRSPPAIQDAEAVPAPQAVHAGHRSYSHGLHGSHYGPGSYSPHEQAGGQGGYRPRIHSHQRIGPGSNAIRDAERWDRGKERLDLTGGGAEHQARLKREEDHDEGVLAAASFPAPSASTGAVPSSTRVPTPPYIIRSHAEREFDMANHPSRAHEALDDSR